ncbi:ubiquitin-protein ligase E3B isoform X2 [Phymastichus coffea]|nr:ubiquitin-protein ligase E3B isoform X2 [Phymastichus coffea]
MCRYIIQSLDSESHVYSYIGVALSKDRHLLWLSQIKKILCCCLTEMQNLNPEQTIDYKSILLRLHTLISFTSIKTWNVMKASGMERLETGMNQVCSNIVGCLINQNFYYIIKGLLIKGLCRNTVTLHDVALTAITTLTIRPLILSKQSEKLMLMYMIHVFSIPGLIYHLNKKDNSLSIQLFKQHNIFNKIIDVLKLDRNLESVFDALEGNYTLCLLANLVELAQIDTEKFCSYYISNFIDITTKLLKFCQQYVVAKKSNTTYWHPILGWFKQPEDQSLQVTMDILKIQLSYLWTGKILTFLICDPLSDLIERESLKKLDLHQTCSKNIFRQTFSEFRINQQNKKFYRKFDNIEVKKISLICSLYYTAVTTLREMKSAIFSGLSYEDKNILHNLWIFFGTLGPHCGLKAFIDHLSKNPECTSSEFQMLMLFCDCMTRYITVLDDIEMYEQQDPFKLIDFVQMSYFLNHFLFKAMSSNLFNTECADQNVLFISMHTLLMSIYRRDCQKKFCKDDHWLIKEIRLSSFLTDLEKKKPVAVLILSKMPHILPHSERLLLFRKYISEEKIAIGLTENIYSNSLSTLITVHRSRIIEDGYRQLSILSPKALKSIIRVRFVNEQGLDEAGIDQDGVFKEFLEETIKKVFNPSLNLFSMTSDNRLYPSYTSSVQDNHLLLFEFVGRMLGKAVYEGIVVDVPFASFFVSQFCGQSGGVMYSWLDELASLDQELYRSLTMVKRHKGDISDLELSFSVDDNVMGKIVTYELKPGGKAIPVTNENKINYIHLMAGFRMYVQIKEQIAAFTRGFRSIINPEWLPLFSTPEWQKLISGDNSPLDFRDLRRHTQYYGGFHDKHKIICWLWDILENDFSETEKALFLKFVTSCSKSPLLGFAHLEPPFSIRCVEVGDDEDVGDTIGSVIRGFFTIRKKDPQNRLPTSSTCFNLLKLPNYQKKNTLREKLRYAVTSNTGFELS